MKPQINHIRALDINWDPVIDMVEANLQLVIRTGRQPDDATQYIFEAVMEAMYGKEIWDTYNKLLH